ncbi:hypothetical protein N656DRAFT_412808 [Canariomyces notabilis]|uniref:Uncharacterized protein n=1 Tax=Canariomyces notabilis TaxID=2074819 RepID=A0AAN6QH30_9PEZI|nr:hypothetical protein N656DRAFT_412808 [Canariomyces arenarius]
MKLLGRRDGMMRWPPPILGVTHVLRTYSAVYIGLGIGEDGCCLLLALNDMKKFSNADYTLIKRCNSMRAVYAISYFIAISSKMIILLSSATLTAEKARPLACQILIG